MVVLTGFSDGFVFSSDGVFQYQGAYTSLPQRPDVCDKCASTAGSFHAHGRYRRWLNTLNGTALCRVRVWRQRWLCLCCGRTMSNGTPDVLAYVPNCTLIIVALLWGYLQSSRGLHHSIAPGLDEAACPRTLSRYLKRAKAVSRTTQQAIREVLIEIKEPRPWEQGISHGLSPPDWILRRHRGPDETASLWRALAMLVNGAKNLLLNPCLLMARARRRIESRHTRFLLGS